MQGYKQAHTNLRIRDAGMQVKVHEPEIWGCKNVRIQVSTHEHKDTRMRGCENTSKYTEF